MREDHSYLQIKRVLISFKLSLINLNQKVAAQMKIFGLLLLIVWQVQLVHWGTYDDYNIKVDIFSCQKTFCFLLAFNWTLLYMQHEALGLNDMSEIWKK